MRSSRLTLFLFLGIAVLAAVHVSLSLCAPSARSRTMLRPVLLDPAFVPSELVLERAGEPAVRIVRDGSWRMTSPFASGVDEQAVLRIFDLLSTVRATETVPEAELPRLGCSRADIGLEKPTLTLALSDGTATHAFDFGSVSPASNSVYVAERGETDVRVVPVAVRAAVDLAPEAFRRREVLSGVPENVQSFEIRQRPGSVRTFARDGYGWRLGASAASAEKVERLLKSVTDARADDFIWPVGASGESATASAALLAGYGLDADNAVTLTLRFQNGEDQRLSFGRDAREGRCYALVQNGEAIVTLPTSLRENAGQDVALFTDARLFPQTPSSVTSCSLTLGDVTLILARTDDAAWRLESPVAAPADSALAETLLANVLALSQDDVRSEGLTVSVSTNGASVTVAPEKVLAGHDLAELRSTDILRLPPVQVKRLVSFCRDFKSAVTSSVAFVRSRGVWTVDREGTEETVAERSVRNVLKALERLQAVKVVALKATAADLAAYGLDRPHLTLAVDLEGEGLLRRNIIVGGKAPGGRYATVGSSEAIFVLSPACVSVLSAPLVEKK